MPLELLELLLEGELEPDALEELRLTELPERLELPELEPDALEELRLTELPERLELPELELDALEELRLTELPERLVEVAPVVRLVLVLDRSVVVALARLTVLLPVLRLLVTVLVAFVVVLLRSATAPERLADVLDTLRVLTLFLLEEPARELIVLLTNPLLSRILVS